MLAFAGELIFDRPVAFGFVEGDDAAMRDGTGEAQVSVMFGVEHIARGVCLPLVDARADVFDEGKQRVFIEAADLLAIDAHRVVISRRAKPITPSLARRVDESAGVAQEGRAI